MILTVCCTPSIKQGVKGLEFFIMMLKEPKFNNVHPKYCDTSKRFTEPFRIIYSVSNNFPEQEREIVNAIYICKLVELRQ